VLPQGFADHFALFGLPRVFSLDMAALDSAYRAVQSQVHPDKFAASADSQKRAAMQWATQANEAYQTLKNPIKRASYLLSLSGVEVAAESNTAMEPAFLMQQMEWREAMEDAAAAKNMDALEHLLADLRTDRDARLGKLGGWLDSGAAQPAAQAVRQLMFIDKATQEIRGKIAALEHD
jgi:molecular chaperone HscB